MIAKIINEKYLSLWKEFFQKSDLTKNWPILYGDFTSNSLLFVGINPSSSEIKTEEMKQILIWKDIDPTEEKKKIIQRQHLEAIGKGESDPYPYFKPIIDIAEFVGCGDKWEHIDLFVAREKNQNIFSKMLGINPNDKGVNNEFGQKQLEIAFDIIREIKPVAIVIVNALASKIIQSHPKFPQISDREFEKYGYHHIILNNKKIPIFFSGMLSGQRALDNGSKERLKWHIKMALKQNR